MNNTIYGDSNYVEIVVAGQSNTLKIQWGMVNTGTAVTFDIPFSDTNYVVVGINSSSATQNSIYLSNKNTESMTISKSGDANQVNWLTIGY